MSGCRSGQSDPAERDALTDMFYVYILESVEYKHYYIGSTSNLEKRITRHNEGGSVWTKRYKPWKIIYTEQYLTKTESLCREREIKSWKRGNEFKKLIDK